MAETGHTYDSSVFPSLPYFVARAGAIVTYAAQGQRSQSLVGNWRQFKGPRQPYQPSRTNVFSSRGQPLGLWEYPMAVATPLGLPMIGTFVPMYPKLVRRALAFLGTKLAPSFNLELHAIDFSDVEDGFSSLLMEAQPGLSQPLGERVEALSELISTMQRRMDVKPLRDWSTRIARA